MQRSHRSQGLSEFSTILEAGFEVCCTPIMADEKKRTKDIILWIITVLLIGLAVFLYKK